MTQNSEGKWVMKNRLDNLEQKLVHVHGFLLKLFGNNFEEYCKSQCPCPDNEKISGRKSPLSTKDNSSQHQNLNKPPRKNRHQVVSSHENVSEGIFTINGETTVIPLHSNISLSNDGVHHSLDPLFNPFLESDANQGNDPIAIDRVDDSITIQDAPISVDELQSQENYNDTFENRLRSEESVETSDEVKQEHDIAAEYDTDRLYFFDDGVDQGQFSGYFDEAEEAEPFQLSNPSRTCIPAAVSCELASASFPTTPTGGEDTSQIKIKIENDDSNDNGDKNDRRPKRAVASYPSTSKNSRSKRMRKTGNDNDEDSDFKLESGEDEGSSSSSSSDSDPDWRTTYAKTQTTNVIPRRGRPSKFVHYNRPTSTGRIPTTSRNKLPIIVPLPPQINSRIRNISGVILPTKVPISTNSIEMLPKVINGVYFRLVSLATDKSNKNIMQVKAKCGICATTQEKPVIVVGYGKSSRNFIDHLETFHTAHYQHYKTNAQNIDMYTSKLRKVIAKHSAQKGPNAEAILISKCIRKLTSLNPS